VTPSATRPAAERPAERWACPIPSLRICEWQEAIAIGKRRYRVFDPIDGPQKDHLFSKNVFCTVEGKYGTLLRKATFGLQI
jgi:hypothetical protein